MVIFDFHIHSRYSFDSLMSPEMIVQLAQEKGLDCIAITDHNTTKGGVDAKKYENEHISVLIGEEILTNHGDLIGINITEDINEHDFFKAIDEIERQGGISVLPHPYKGHKNVENIAQYVDIIEAYNSRTSYELNEKAKDLAKRLNKPYISGSDAHCYREIGNAKNMGSLNDFDFEILSYTASNIYLINLSQLIKSVKLRHLRTFLMNFASIVKNISADFLINTSYLCYYLFNYVYFTIFFYKLKTSDVVANVDVLYSSYLISWREYRHRNGKIYEYDLMIGDVIEKSKQYFDILCIDMPALFRPVKKTYHKFGLSPEWICIEQFINMASIFKAFYLFIRYLFGCDVGNNLDGYFTITRKPVRINSLLNLIISEEIISLIKPKILFLTCEYCQFHRELAYIAHLNDIIIIALQHGIITPVHHGYIFNDEKMKPVLPDITCVYGQYHYDLLINESIYEPDNVVVTGQPRYDVLYYADKLYSKYEFLKNYSVDDNHTIILWTTQCHGLSDDENIKNINAIFKAIKNIKDVTIIIKQHPGEGGKYTKMIKNYINQYNVDAIITPKNSDTYEQLYVCDLMITKSSTTAMEAVALEKPVIVLNLSGEPDVVNYVEEGIALGVYREDDLKPAIEKLIKDDSELAENRTRYIKKYLYKIDGNATERVVTEINKILLKNTSVEND